MKLPKIPIDYTKAGTGEAPFDGNICLLIAGASILTGRYIKPACPRCTADNPFTACFDCGKYSIGAFKTMYGDFFKANPEVPLFPLPTHYSPMPEFVEQKESE